MKSMPNRNFPACYICGYSKTGAYEVAIKNQGASSPYFPFLESHEPPEGSRPPTKEGKILSCYLCYKYLNQQWLTYEKDKVPPVKRLYWLKRVDNGPYTGVEMGVQSEYASQILGFTPDPPNLHQISCNSNSTSEPMRHLPIPQSVPVNIDNQNSIDNKILISQSINASNDNSNQALLLGQSNNCLQQRPLDLSVESKRGVKRLHEETLPKSPCDTSSQNKHLASTSEVLDLSMPDKNAATEVCYVCGEDNLRGTLMNISANPSNRGPFFPSLIDHPRPSRSRPMEAAGIVQGCVQCYSYLLNQWKIYEVTGVPHNDRHYVFLRVERAINNTTTSFFTCYRCGLSKQSDCLKLVYSRENEENEPFFPEIEKMTLMSGASPISPQGMVQICSDCHKIITVSAQKIKSLKLAANDNVSTFKDLDKTADTSRIIKSPITPNFNSLDINNDVDISCFICHQHHQPQLMKWLAIVPEKADSEGAHFLFLKLLPRFMNTIFEEGRVLVCTFCHQHLLNQWTEYEKENIPVKQRQYSLRVISTSSQSPRLTPGPPNSPPSCMVTNFIKASNILENIQIKTKTDFLYQGQSIKDLEIPVTENPSLPVLPVMTTQRPLSIAINCFICGMHSKFGQTYIISSTSNENGYFFPFLSKYTTTHPEARIDNAHVLVCNCCFHSLVLQWQVYEKNQIEQYARLYDTHNFFCYICDIQTYRKRLYQLAVKNYPFLKEHTNSPGGLVVADGHAVIVCKDCYSSLKDQYTELEKWGVPVEKRQYNWIRRPPPQRDSPNGLTGSSESCLDICENRQTLLLNRDLSLSRNEGNSLGDTLSSFMSSSKLKGVANGSTEADALNPSNSNVSSMKKIAGISSLCDSNVDKNVSKTPDNLETNKTIIDLDKVAQSMKIPSDEKLVDCKASIAANILNTAIDSNHDLKVAVSSN